VGDALTLLSRQIAMNLIAAMAGFTWATATFRLNIQTGEQRFSVLGRGETTRL
jgi:hypothetical protein